ncbi:MAG TPA: proline dehydrogenase family protein [Longilinea sp.]|nr:proline dehydrogenase family protein [Longilinea sp.]
MLRAFFIFLSKASWAQNLITRWGVAWRAASRFIAGETGEDAIRAIQQLNAVGILATVDHLGENTSTAAEARQSTDEILQILDLIHASSVQANVSIKLSQIGLLLDEDLCRQNLSRILDHARLMDNFVRIDMEDSTLTDKTLACLRWARNQGFSNVGIVIQSYLYRSDKDLAVLIDEGIRVRLVKGAYREPATAAYPAKSDVDAAFDRLTEMMIAGTQKRGVDIVPANGRFPAFSAIASHDPDRIQTARDKQEEYNLPTNALEFQMLYGIRRDLQQQLSAAGYPVRVYVPYGTRWYPYFMRRLAERPANVWFFLSNFFRH